MIDSVVENVIGLERGPDEGLRSVFKELRSCTGRWSCDYLPFGLPSQVGTFVGGSYCWKEKYIQSSRMLSSLKEVLKSGLDIFRRTEITDRIGGVRSIFHWSFPSGRDICRKLLLLEKKDLLRRRKFPYILASHVAHLTWE